MFSCEFNKLHLNNLLTEDLHKLNFIFECCHAVLVNKFKNNQNLFNLDVFLVKVIMTVYASQFEETVNEEQTV